MSEHLASKLDCLHGTECERLDSLVSFKEWMTEVVAIDHELRVNLKCLCAVLKEEEEAVK